MAFDGPLIGGRYRLGPRLGKGSQGELFLAQDERAKGGDEREVVVKRLTPRGTWKSFELFEREAKVLSQLRHAGVPHYLATVEEPPGTFNLVMQRMRGDNLRDLAARRRLSQLELRDILIRALEILDYLHGRSPPVIHRDLKPSNIMRAPDGTIALVDFGGVLDAARDHGGSTIVGTYGYMAPEQLHGQVTPATDLYALAAIAYRALTGRPPRNQFSTSIEWTLFSTMRSPLRSRHSVHVFTFSMSARGWKRMPPLYGPRAPLCCTRYPSKIRSFRSSMRTGSCARISRHDVFSSSSASGSSRSRASGP